MTEANLPLVIAVSHRFQRRFSSKFSRERYHLLQKSEDPLFTRTNTPVEIIDVTASLIFNEPLFDKLLWKEKRGCSLR